MNPGIETLFRDYSNMVFRICYRYTRNREESDDLTQEVFIRVNKGLPGFDGRCALGTWIYRIAVNICIDALRAKKSLGEIDLASLDLLVVRNLAGGGDQELARIDLERILNEMDPEIREYLLLTQGEGLSYEEAAIIVRKSPAAIAKAVSRFRSQYATRRPRLLDSLGLRLKGGKGIR